MRRSAAWEVLRLRRREVVPLVVQALWAVAPGILWMVSAWSKECQFCLSPIMACLVVCDWSFVLALGTFFMAPGDWTLDYYLVQFPVGRALLQVNGYAASNISIEL